MFALQILDGDSDRDESEEIQKAARRCLHVKAFAEEMRRKEVWRAPRGLHAVQAFQNHIFLTMSRYFDNMDLCLHGEHLPCTVWSEKSVSRLNSFDVDSQLSHECSIYGVHIKPTTIAHPQEGICCFANQKSAERNLNAYVYGLLMYQIIVHALNTRGAHEEDVLMVTCEHFHTLARQLAKDVFSLDGILHSIWLVPARISCLRFINDPRPLSRETGPADGRLEKARSEIVKFIHIETARSYYTMLEAVSVGTTCNKSPIEYLFVDYGKTMTSDR